MAPVITLSLGILNKEISGKWLENAHISNNPAQ